MHTNIEINSQDMYIYSSILSFAIKAHLRGEEIITKKVNQKHLVFIQMPIIILHAEFQ